MPLSRPQYTLCGRIKPPPADVVCPILAIIISHEPACSEAGPRREEEKTKMRGRVPKRLVDFV